MFVEIGDQSQRVSYIRDLVRTLPLPNHNTMEVLFRHLCRWAPSSSNATDMLVRGGTFSRDAHAGLSAIWGALRFSHEADEHVWVCLWFCNNKNRKLCGLARGSLVWTQSYLKTLFVHELKTRRCFLHHPHHLLRELFFFFFLSLISLISLYHSLISLSYLPLSLSSLFDLSHISLCYFHLSLSHLSN